MRSLLLFLLPLLFPAWSAPAAAAKPLSVIGQDAWVVLSVDSLQGLREALEGHPLAEAVAGEELRALFSPPPDEEGGADNRSFREVMEEEFHLTPDAFFELFPGEVHFILYGIDGLAEVAGQRPELALLAEFTGDQARLDELMDIQFERNAKAQKEKNPAMEHHMIEERFMGETLRFDEAFDGERTYIEDGYALVDGVFVLATPEARLRGLVEALKEGVDAPLARTPGYLRMSEEESPAEISFYVNFPAFVSALEEGLRKAAAVPWMAASGVTADSLVGALALEALEAFYFDCRFREDGLLLRTGLSYREKKGLTALLTYGRGGLPKPVFVPEDPVSSSVSLFDFSAFVTEFQRLLASASPSLGQMVDMQIQMAETNLGIPLRESVLENFGQEVVAFAQFDVAGPAAPAGSQPRQVMAFSMRDTEAFRSALDGLLGQNPGLQAVFETEEFEGHTIFTVRGQPHPTQEGVRLDDISYAVSRTHVFLSIGRVAVLKECLGRLDRADGGFWQRGEVDDWFEPISRPAPVSRSYTDVESMVDSVLASLREAWAGNPGVGGGKLPDLEALAEELDLPFVLLAEVNEEPDGIFSRALMRTKPEEPAR